MTKILELEYKEELQQRFNIRTAMEEASRCLLCHDAPCSKACPAATNPGDFIRSIRFRNIKGAAEIIRTNNVLGGSCSLICPHAKLCEEACSRTGIDKPIEIGRLQAFAVEQEKLFGMEILKPAKEKNGFKVACIGSGPASLACASSLALEGFDVTVFEEQEEIGGVLTYGINPSRLPLDLLEFDLDIIKSLGIDFKTNTRIDGKEGIEKLKEEYDAIHVGVGLSTSRILESEKIDCELEGVITALDFLKDARVNDGKIDIGENVIIIGGGDVAMDCALTANQLGANTKIVYRRTIEEAPANEEELRVIQESGIPIITGFAPEATVEEDGKLVGLEFKPFNSDDDYSRLNIKADNLILALGQDPTDDYKDFKTSEGVFASGDLVNSGETVVQAVADGKLAALDISQYLSNKEVK